MSYRDMASDVEHFIKRHNLDNDNKELILMGHSMGGRVAMEVALTNEVPLDKLILVDISPLKMDIKSSFEKYLLAMKEVESAKLTKQSQADEILKKSVSDIGVRQFLLTNYKKNPSTAIYNFRNPLDVITEHLDEIGHLAINSRTFSKPTLFIRGTKSHYLDPSTYAQIKAIFLQSEFEDIEAGHWVHSENPNAFIRACLNYLN
jgi:pimeloyl-ACP methyl ester carboxylesterase